MRLVFDDGGRSIAGYKGMARDCAVRAAAIVTGIPYQDVYDSINQLAGRHKGSGKRKISNARTGVWPMTLGKFLEPHGFQWVATMGIGTGCKVHLIDGELPMGKLVVRLSKHYAAVLDGVIHDAVDPRRATVKIENGVERIVHRCVYGYWIYMPSSPDNSISISSR